MGGPWAEGDSTPRSIAKAYFDKICPRPTKIHAKTLHKIHGQGANALEIEQTWLEYLSKIDDPCLEVTGKAGKDGSIFHT